MLWLATAVLLIMYALALSSITGKSPTFDEQGFITRGLGYVRGENQHMRVGHPLGLNALNASLLAADGRIALPTDDPSWEKTNFHRPSELFMWEMGNDVERIMYLARLPTIWLGMLLTAVVGRWAWEMTRNRRAGLLAMILVAFDPNLLAHSRLATTDLGLTAGAVIAGYTLWRFLKRPSFTTAIIAGIGFGLLQNTKFTAGLFVPLLALVILVALVSQWWRDGRFPTPMLLYLIIVYPLAAFFALWAAYSFQVGALPDNLPTFPQLSGLTLPLSHHLEQLLDIGGRMQKGTPSFLLGNYSDSGWWTYFPITFLLKTPLPTLILLGWAAVRLIRKQVTHHVSRITAVDLTSLLIPALGYFVIALTTDINLGYRHLLPILPFLVVFIASQLGPIIMPPSTFRLPHSLIVLLMVWLVGIALWIFPHYLAYFNVLAGGPDNGWQYLVDSNIDWGQDLAGLKGWMDENEVDHIWLSYFGEVRPDYYGIKYTGLASWPPRLMNPQTRPFYPHDPAPGIYAISVTNLQGVQFDDHDLFAWFREQEPMAKIGYSIFVYEVEPYGDPADLLLSGVQIDEISPEDYALLGTNDVTLRWFDARQSWLIPPRMNVWLALSNETIISPRYDRYAEGLHVETKAPAYTLYFDLAARKTVGRITTFTDDEFGIISLAWASEPELTAVSNTIVLETAWLQESLPQPVKIFVHVTNAEGELIAQWDGLGAAWEGWHPVDLLLHTHSLTFPEDTSPGTYQIWTGLYHPETGQRWQTGGADRYLIGEIEIGERP